MFNKVFKLKCKHEKTIIIKHFKTKSYIIIKYYRKNPNVI